MPQTDRPENIAQICMNGHVIVTSVTRYPQFKQPFCTDCGEPTIEECQNCHWPIAGVGPNAWMGGGGPYQPPKYCAACGKRFPWAEATPPLAKEHADDSSQEMFVANVRRVSSEQITSHLPAADDRFRFQVALSFPGEHRPRVAKIASRLADTLSQDKVLYDKFHSAEFARPNLDTYLPTLYHQHSLLLVFFLCGQFTQKEWCGLEWRAGRDLLKRGEDNRLMFLRLDQSDIPGLYSIDGYLDIESSSEEDVTKAILERLSIVRAHVTGLPAPPARASDAHIMPASKPLVEQPLETNSFYALGEDGYRASDYIQVLAVPRPRSVLTIDVGFEREHKHLIASFFPDIQSFDERIAQGNFCQWNSNRSGRSWATRRWIASHRGVLGYMASLPHDRENPVGDIVADYLFSLRFAHAFFNRYGIVGACTLTLVLACEKARFSPRFPPPDGDPDDYDVVAGIGFPEPTHWRCGWSAFTSELDIADFDTVDSQVRLISEVVRLQLSKTWEARIDSKRFEEAVSNLARQIRYPTWGKLR
jgi:hypothetical protein